MSALQCRNADWPKSVRPAVGRPVQASGQLVDHANRRGSITCSPARSHSCLCGRRDCLSLHARLVLTAFLTTPQPLRMHPIRPSLALFVISYHHQRHQNQKTNLRLHSAARPASGFLQVVPIETASARTSLRFRAFHRRGSADRALMTWGQYQPGGTRTCRASPPTRHDGPGSDWQQTSSSPADNGP